MATEDKWSEYWANESDAGECFVNKEGGKHPELKAFWTEQLQHLSSEKSKVIDVACGAGSIYRENENAQKLQFFALDFSFSATSRFHEAFPECSTVNASATHLPFLDNSFDVMVSQFGIEYAGIDAIINAPRVVKTGGKIVFLSHIEDGYIDAKNKAELEGIMLCHDIKFVEVAKRTVVAAFGDNISEKHQSLAAFMAIEPTLSQYAHTHQFGVHHHLYWGFRQLFTRRLNYQLNDITAWLDGVAKELVKSEMRLTEMRKAALSKQQIAEIRSGLRNSCMAVDIMPFSLSGHSKPVAWKILATKV